jgi:hypothetical protein
MQQHQPAGGGGQGIALAWVLLNMSLQEFTFIFYPAALAISSVFLFVTLLAYSLDPDLHRPLFGKITIGFVINNLIAYICLVVIYISGYLDLIPSHSIGCIIAGYSNLYTFTAFMFWINAMAANMFFKFSSIMTSSASGSHSWKLLLYVVYAQGMPLILCLVVAFMEYYGPCDTVRSGRH